MHTTSLNDFARFVAKYLTPQTTLSICDVGSQDVNGSYRDLLTCDRWSYLGIDITGGKNVDLVVPEYEWSSIPPNTFDVVVSGQCLEHVPMPWRWIRSVSRIVKPGGLIYVTAPNTWAFHEYPVDCWRVWPDGLRALFDEASIATLEAYFNGPDTTAIGRKN